MSSLWAQIQYDPYENKNTEQHKTCRTPKSNRHSENTHYIFLIHQGLGIIPSAGQSFVYLIGSHRANAHRSIMYKASLKDEQLCALPEQVIQQVIQPIQANTET